jgi:YD repeat-containing protein
LSEDDDKKYYYDYRNRLVKVTDLNNNLIVSYEYDAAGHRIKKSLADGTTIKYVYSGKNVIFESKTSPQPSPFEGGEEEEIVLNKEYVYSNKVDDVVAVFVEEEVEYVELLLEEEEEESIEIEELVNEI